MAQYISRFLILPGVPRGGNVVYGVGGSSVVLVFVVLVSSTVVLPVSLIAPTFT